MTPRTWTDWIVLAAIGALGIAALAWVLPLTVRMPFLVPLDSYHRYTGDGASRKPGAELMNSTSIFASVIIVVGCALLWGWWMNLPITIRPSKHRRTGSGRSSDRSEPR